jgi:hypothetical protein
MGLISPVIILLAVTAYLFSINNILFVPAGIILAMFAVNAYNNRLLFKSTTKFTIMDYAFKGKFK